MYNLGPNVIRLFDHIVDKIQNEPVNHYTVDQPYLNHALQNDTFTRPHIRSLSNSIISFNGHNNMGEAFFINCAGCPGDGPFHFRKMLEMSIHFNMA